jgi:hypothetical protein
MIGTYDTALDGLWTLSGWSLGRAESYENFIDIPGHGPLDLSTVLTDGEPYYGSRPFEATLESSEGTRMEREEIIDRMINELDGWRLDIVLPDDPLHYITGRVRVEKLFNNLAHASVRVTATCDPWRYNNSETVVALTATTSEQVASLINAGRCSVVPTITVSGGSVTLKFSAGTEVRTWALSPGTYTIADIYLKTGSAPLHYSGSGRILLTYREAVL